MESNTPCTFLLSRKTRPITLSSKSGSKAHPSTQLRLLMRPINTVNINTAIAASFLIMINCYAFANLTPLQQQAKSLGLERYNQYKVATPALSIAAEAGDREAQFYLAEELRQQKKHITAVAQKWYEAAAAQGDYYAI